MGRPRLTPTAEQQKLKNEAERFHDITQEQWDFAHLQLEAPPELLDNPFSHSDFVRPDQQLLEVMMNPDYFGWTCTKLFNTAISPNGLELLPFQCAILRELWYRPFPILIATRGGSKTFLLAVYSLLRALFLQGRKIVITGAGFRQSKLVLSYAEQLWNNSPVFRDICGASRNKSQGVHRGVDQWWMEIGESLITALPIGDGSKIRGQRAHDVIGDEFASINPLIFEEVIAGFGVVNIDPISQVKHLQRMKYLNNSDSQSENKTTSSVIMPNQMILSGTASFAFNHFCTYWKKHKDIILSQGHREKMAQLGIDSKLDYTKYSVIRIPVHLLPTGFMDQAQIDRSEATQQSGVYNNEFCATFSDDSNGFFKSSVLSKAMPSRNNPVVFNDGTSVESFPCLLQGNKQKKYIMAIDPASQRDNFAIVILEIYSTHARIIHCWTTNAQKHLELRSLGGTVEKDFYAYCCRRIRDFMKQFTIIHIAIDSQGGGRTISELLHNDKYVEDGEQLIWENDESHILWDGKEKPTDTERGLHILEMVNFRDGKYTSDANHGMKSDFEQRLLLFPYFDDIEKLLAGKDDTDKQRSFDTLEDVVNEIDELRDELMMIVHDATASGYERWGAPTVKGNKIGEIHDDRYSALLMANSAARRIRQIPTQEVSYVGGGFVGQGAFNSAISSPADAARLKSQPLYVGPAWFTDSSKSSKSFGMIVDRE